MAGHRDGFDVIAAFVDGERVDTRALHAALADAAGRDYLIDLVAIREIAGGRDDEPSVSAPGRVTHRWSTALTGLAAALALAVGLTGYAIGQQRAQEVPVAILPPLDADVIVAMEAPPAPTQVIHLGSDVRNGGRE